MTIRFRCPHCQRAISADDRRAGSSYKCPSCDQEGVVPRPAELRHRRPPSARPKGDEEEVQVVQFYVKRQPDEGLDMTPMVDVTFLLLIFFMVTAAFTLQKSLEMPPPDKEESAENARTIEEIEQDDDYIIVRIAKDNTIWVDEREAHSEQDLLTKLRESARGDEVLGGQGPSNLLVMADRECTHETVVMALDAGNAVGLEHVRLATVDDEDF